LVLVWRPASWTSSPTVHLVRGYSRLEIHLNYIFSLSLVSQIETLLIAIFSSDEESRRLHKHRRAGSEKPPPTRPRPRAEKLVADQLPGLSADPEALHHSDEQPGPHEDPAAVVFSPATDARLGTTTTTRPTAHPSHVVLRAKVHLGAQAPKVPDLPARARKVRRNPFWGHELSSPPLCPALLLLKEALPSCAPAKRQQRQAPTCRRASARPVHSQCGCRDASYSSFQWRRRRLRRSCPTVSNREISEHRSSSSRPAGTCL
jgi:hypothetical protein